MRGGRAFVIVAPRCGIATRRAAYGRYVIVSIVPMPLAKFARVFMLWLGCDATRSTSTGGLGGPVPSAAQRRQSSVIGVRGGNAACRRESPLFECGLEGKKRYHTARTQSGPGQIVVGPRAFSERWGCL